VEPHGASNQRKGSVPGVADGGGKAVVATPTSRPGGAAAGDTIKIASFNIQVFGTSKLKKPEVMDVLCQVVRRFDVVAIQEVRSTDDTVLPKFVQMINAGGGSYDFVVGPRLGRTNSKEQYAFVFNTQRLAVDRSSVYTVPDPRDLLHREPLVARFVVQGPPAQQAFSFTLVNIHTDPDETRTELDALADVFTSVQNNGSGEDDVILLGDLNVDERHLGRLGQLPGITWAITGVPTNTRKTKQYDNIVFHKSRTAEYTGRFGVVDLMADYGLSEAQALQVSDHLPIWAEFTAVEAPRR
ncbi:MAG: endonuclease/exonuclease/phosphatase family protein, partial [Gemmataceae bacterium]|nr:endonuclease/exonuclease/phosphatase family protein [Gemmataceae bacterium]